MKSDSEEIATHGYGRWARQSRIGIVSCLLVTFAPSVLADTYVHKYLNASAVLNVTNGRTEAQFQPLSTSSRTTVSALELEQAVVRAANQQQLHPALLLAVMKAESSFHPLVVSKAGAVGLMQLVPETAKRHGVRNLYDTDDNIAGGAKHLRYLLDRFHGNTRLALAAYNAGERTVDRYSTIPP